MEAPYFAYIVGMVSALYSLLEHAGDMPVLHNRFIVMFWIGDPHDLHFGLFGSKSKMYLFMPWIVSDFYLCDPDEFLESNLCITICIEEIEYRLCMLSLDLMFGFYEGEVVDEILEIGFAIFIGIIGAFPEGLEVRVGHFSCGNAAEKNEKCEGQQKGDF